MDVIAWRGVCNVCDTGLHVAGVCSDGGEVMNTLPADLQVEYARPVVQAEIAVFALSSAVRDVRETFERYPREVRALISDVMDELNELDAIAQRVSEGMII